MYYGPLVPTEPSRLPKPKQYDALESHFQHLGMTRITDLEQHIRGLINAPRKHRAIFGDSAEYHKLCSCLDVIGDTELAFHAYEEMPDDPAPGSSYVLAYGLLQALVLQQDAVRHRGNQADLVAEVLDSSSIPVGPSVRHAVEPQPGL